MAFMNLLKNLGSGQSKRLISTEGFSGGPMVKNLPANAGGMGSIPGAARSYMPMCHNY